MPGSKTIPRPGLPGWAFASALLAVIALLELAGPRTPRRPSPSERVFITELAATREASIRDDDGDLADWIELGNYGEGAVNLDGWYLTDNFRKLAKWRFPAVEIPPGARLVVFASGKDRRNTGQRLHTNFELDESGEYLALVRPDGRTVAQEFLPRFPRQSGRHTFGLRDSLRLAFAASGIPFDAYRYFDHGTPGLPNSLELAGLTANVRYSAAGGVYEEPLTVALFSATAAAAIRFTTDGSVPDRMHGRRYRGPFQIRRNTVLKALALRPGFGSSEVTTHTYLFPNTVAQQNGEGFPPAWGLTNGQPVRASYTLSTQALAREGPARIAQALGALPTLALSTTLSNLFDPRNGIYANPTEHGPSWERPVTAEWFPVDGARGFQIDAGLRIQGGWNRRPEECPKHSMRLVFKKEFGEARLQFPLFGRDGVASFETLTLRGGCNNSWLHWDSAERRRGDYARDEWMRQSQAAMGHPAARGRFAHLYLNGLYWGLYNIVERPGAPFLAAHEGGKRHDFDAIAAGDAISGDLTAWHELFDLANRGLEQADAYAAVGSRVDLVSFADYMLLNFYGANADWDRSSNWYAARRRNPPGRFAFFVWDGERTLESPDDDRIDADDDLSPTRLFHCLARNAVFRNLFAERARLHCGEGGVLSPAVAGERYQQIARALEPALDAEAARWGAYRHDVHPYKTGPYEVYSTDRHWRPEVQRLLTLYFPRRAAIFLEQLRRHGLLNDESAPH